jgi:hypothetical protein
VNFIKRLQAENETRAAAIEAMERELNEVRRYLTSEKFQRPGGRPMILTQIDITLAETLVARADDEDLDWLLDEVIERHLTALRHEIEDYLTAHPGEVKVTR